MMYNEKVSIITRKRRAPSGGCAYGMPRKANTVARLFEGRRICTPTTPTTKKIHNQFKQTEKNTGGHFISPIISHIRKANNSMRWISSTHEKTKKLTNKQLDCKNQVDHNEWIHMSRWPTFENGTKLFFLFLCAIFTRIVKVRWIAVDQMDPEIFIFNYPVVDTGLLKHEKKNKWISK